MLVELFEKDKADYNHFVSQQPGGSFLQSWEWGDWQKALGREVARYKITGALGAQIASAQFIKMPLLGKKYYWYAPYGPVVSNEWEGDSGQLAGELQEKFRDALFIRIEPKVLPLTSVHHSLLIKSTNIQPAITMLLDLQTDDEVLLAAMHHKTRYNIRLAERQGVYVESELVVTPGHGLYVEEAVNLILETQGRQNYRGHSKQYYKQLVDFFALRNANSDLKLVIYKALYQKQLLAAGIMLDFGRERMYLYGGSSDRLRNLMAPYLLHWQAIKDARKDGRKYYDFGGSEVASGGERGFTRFKQGFGGKVETYSGAYDIVQNKITYRAYSALRALNKLVKKISG